MKSRFTSVAISAVIALAFAGCDAGADGRTEEAHRTQRVDQKRIAASTLALENAYDVQFVKGQIDQDALQPLIYDVLQSMPEGVRAKAQARIYDVISQGRKDVSQMTPEQRAAIAAPVSADSLSEQQVEWLGAWGWKVPVLDSEGGLIDSGWDYGGWGCCGFGGLGAYGWPGFYGPTWL